MQKSFVLDTNVLLHNAAAVDSFEDNIVVLPMAVIEELDKFKTRSDELGRNARAVIRHIDSLRAQGSLRDGVPMANGGILKILTSRGLPADPDLEADVPDNRILRLAYAMHEAGSTVIFVSKDINARLKADALGVEAQDYEHQKVKFDELFSGYREVDVPAEAVDNFYNEEIYEYPGLGTLANEFVLLRDETNPKHTALARAQDADTLLHLNSRFDHAWNIKPRSKEQRLALELLLDPGIQIVTLVGQAGTGKTLLAIAAGLEATLRGQQYEKILVTRPIVPLGKDLGYLPGGKDEKITHWMQPIFDNLSYLMQGGKNGSQPKSSEKVEEKILELQEQHQLELEALTYIRGRSISRQYIVVDEAQNLTPHEVKTIVSRCGEGTKIILTGDAYQIDNPYLDSSSNGLSYAVERLKGQDIHGHMTLRKSERSTLAAIAADLL